MTLARRHLLKLAAAAVAAPAVPRVAWGQAQVTLKLHHFLPPVSNGHSKLLAPWARKVEADSGNRIKIDIFPSMQLGGTQPQLYDKRATASSISSGPCRQHDGRFRDEGSSYPSSPPEGRCRTPSGAGLTRSPRATVQGRATIGGGRTTRLFKNRTDQDLET